MAADLRVSRKASCRRWLESTLKDLEGERVLDATRERWPSHYHIAVFPEAYTRYVARVTGSNTGKVAASTESSGMKIAAVDGGPAIASVVPVASAPKPAPETYTVKSGDSLWTIARRFATTVNAIKQANQLVRSTIHAGQKLLIPGLSSANADE
jgi:LysM repeat protein